MNLKECHDDACIEDIDFDKMLIWIQIAGLSRDMYNVENARRIGESLGRCVKVEPNHILQQRSFLRVQVDIDITKPLPAGLWWTDVHGRNKWAAIKLERISEFCYACGRLGHTSTTCDEEVVLAEDNTGLPLYGPWMVGDRPR